MKRLKKFLFSSKTNIAAFILAVGLLLFASIGGAKATISYLSEKYASSGRVSMQDIGVSLMENGNRVSWRDYDASADGTWNESTGVLLENMIEEGKDVCLDKPYDEVLSVLNSGSINQYVRVSIFKYWTDENGNKLFELDPSYIDLNLINSENWLLDQSASTQERTVLYYRPLLENGMETVAFADKLTIDGALADQPDVYDGAKFWIDIQVDAIQEHNAEDVVMSVWGKGVEIGDNGSLHLK